MIETPPGSSEVITSAVAGLGRISLNRPSAMNALTLEMCGHMTEALMRWRSDPQIRSVLIDHQGERGFCAGGDVLTLVASAANGGELARRFFYNEYQLNHLLTEYPKPVVAVMDGITMGGGVGISMPARYRIATERTLFAMPETGIGLFPDVGGGWWLPRLRGQTGMWLALTGARLKAADCLLLGIATHFVPREQLPLFVEALGRRPDEIESILEAFAEDAGPAPLLENLAVIDEAFAADSLTDVLTRLRASTSPFAMEALRILETKSPQALKVAFRQLRYGAAAESFAEDMVMEYRVASRVVSRPDFREGVRAVLIDKDGAPQWRPTSLEAISDSDLDAIFAPLPKNEEWVPLV